MSCRTRRVGAAVMLALLVVPVAAAPALALEDPVTGYWTKLRPGLPVPVQPPTPVPEGGSWISRDPSGPVAVSALRVAADPGNVIVGLRLPVDRAAGPTAVIVCPTTDNWVPVQGGRLEAAPPADCTTPVETVVEQAVLVVDLPTTMQGESVDVLLAPKDGSTFSLTLKRATKEAVVQQPSSATSTQPPPPVAPPPGVTGPPSDTGFTSDPGFDGGFAPPPVGIDSQVPTADPLLPGPALPEPAAAQPEPQPQTAPAPAPLRLVQAPPAVPEDRTPALAAAALLAGLGALALRLAVAPAPAPRKLGGVARLAPPATATAGAVPSAVPSAVAAPVRGVGRFRAVRSRPPVQI